MSTSLYSKLSEGCIRVHALCMPLFLHGVQEYRIVNWQLKTLEIYRCTDAQLQLVATLFEEDILASPLLPGLPVPLDQIFW